MVRSAPEISGPFRRDLPVAPTWRDRVLTPDHKAAHHKVPKRIRKSRRTYRLRINFLDRPARPPASKMRCQLTLSEFWPVLPGVETAVSPGGRAKRLRTTEGPCSPGFQARLQPSAATSARSLSSSAASQRIPDEARLSSPVTGIDAACPVLARGGCDCRCSWRLCFVGAVPLPGASRRSVGWITVPLPPLAVSPMLTNTIHAPYMAPKQKKKKDQHRSEQRGRLQNRSAFEPRTRRGHRPSHLPVSCAGTSW